MNWVFFLTPKFKAARRRKGIRLVWLLAVMGVALGVATLLLTQSVLSGAEEVFRESILGFNAHLVVRKSGDMEETAWIQDLLKGRYSDEIESGTPFFYREGLVVSKGKVKGAAIKGIDPLTFEGVYDVKVRGLGDVQVPAKIEDLLKSPDGVPSIILGSDLAKELNIGKSGDTLRLFLPKKKTGEKESAKEFQLFRVTGTFTTGFRVFDHGFAFVEISKLQDIYEAPGSVTGLDLRLKDPSAAEALAKELQSILGYGFAAISWETLNGPLFRALRLERGVFFAIMAMVVAVAAFNVIGVLLLMIFDKSREISILRAMGSPNSGLKRLFGLQGLWIGLVGCFWGLLIGGLLAWLLRTSQIFKLEKEVYLIEKMPVQLSWVVITSVVGVTLVIAFLATQFAVARIKKAPLDL